MPVLQFKGKTAIECYHHTVPHHTLEFDSKLSVVEKGEMKFSPFSGQVVLRLLTFPLCLLGCFFLLCIQGYIFGFRFVHRGELVHPR